MICSKTREITYTYSYTSGHLIPTSVMARLCMTEIAAGDLIAFYFYDLHSNVKFPFVYLK